MIKINSHNHAGKDICLLLMLPQNAVIAHKKKKYAAPKGYSIGFIVNSEDWFNRAMPIVYGELVYVNKQARDVQFASHKEGSKGKNAIVVPIDKKLVKAQGLTCEGKIFPGDVLCWQS